MYQYPAAPANVNPALTEPSSIYKKEVAKSVSAIIFFIVSYLLLISMAALVAYACIYIGFGIFSVGTHLLVFVAGGGVMLIGIFLLFFVVKFIFNSYKTNRDGMVEIKEMEQPALFEFIKKITEEAQSPFPKKIFLSNEVNASVFYDSSFWSMFFPVQKNLLIGLGLVNSVTISEFKAILGHEFGHFSQKSMKVGSYIYNANRVIHNLLFDNNSFYKALQKIANLHFILSICMICVNYLVRAIQYILNKIYLFINKQNMKLSREMEFHADSVAASVAGSQPLITSLYRLELAENSFGSVLNYCGNLLDEKKQEKNIYHAHHFMMGKMATENKLDFKNNLPVVNKSTFADFDTTRVNIENQWQSHPSTADREQALNALNIDAAYNNESAWQIFENKEALQERMSKFIYEQAKLDVKDNLLGSFVENKYTQQTNLFDLPKFTKGYWDNKKFPELTQIDFENYKNENSDKAVYTENQLSLSKKLTGLETDINVLNAITKKEMDTATFDFEGTKYNRKQAAIISLNLQKEKEILDAELISADFELLAYQYADAKSKQKESNFMQCYANVLNEQQRNKNFSEINQQLDKYFNVLFDGTETTIDQAREIVLHIITKENEIKKIMQTSKEENPFANEITNTNIEKFIQSNRIYFSVNTFIDGEIGALITDLNNCTMANNEKWVRAKKELLEL